MFKSKINISIATTIVLFVASMNLTTVFAAPTSETTNVTPAAVQEAIKPTLMSQKFSATKIANERAAKLEATKAEAARLAQIKADEQAAAEAAAQQAAEAAAQKAAEEKAAQEAAAAQQAAQEKAAQEAAAQQAAAAAQQQAATTTTAATTTSTSTNYGSDLKNYVLSKLVAATGQSAATWNAIITRESNWNPSVYNQSSGAYGLFQLMPMHGASGSDVDTQIAVAIRLYNAGGMSPWAL